MLRARVDLAVCQGHAVCRRVAPAVFDVNEDDGRAVVLLDAIPPELAQSARNAEQGCPEQAIRLEEDTGAEHQSGQEE